MKITFAHILDMIREKYGTDARLMFDYSGVPITLGRDQQFEIMPEHAVELVDKAYPSEVVVKILV
jgi:hypothetical protein